MQRKLMTAGAVQHIAYSELGTRVRAPMALPLQGQEVTAGLDSLHSAAPSSRVEAEGIRLFNNASQRLTEVCQGPLVGEGERFGRERGPAVPKRSVDLPSQGWEEQTPRRRLPRRASKGRP